MIRLFVLAAILSAGSPALFAQVGTIQQAPPRPGEELPRSVYVGRYGETIEIPYGWAVDPEMRGAAEVVRFHLHDASLAHMHPYSRPYEVQASDYSELKNFTPKGLIQLLVIPKNAPGGFRSLGKLREAKVTELKSSAAVFESFDLSGRWIPPAFGIAVSAPYHYEQFYAESPGEFFILTTGYDFRAKEFGLSREQVLEWEESQREIEDSLVQYLDKFSRPSSNEIRNDPLFYLRFSRSWKILGAFSVMALILAAWPGEAPARRRLRLLGRSLLLFTLAPAGLGLFSIIAMQRLDIEWEYGTYTAALIIPWIPLLSRAMARRWNSARPNRVLGWNLATAALWTGLAVRFALGYGRVMAADATLVCVVMLLLPAGLTAGLAFFFAFGPTCDDPAYEL